MTSMISRIDAVLHARRVRQATNHHKSLSDVRVLWRRKLVRWLESGRGAAAFPGLISAKPRRTWSAYHKAEVGPFFQWEVIGAYFPDALADVLPPPVSQTLARGQELNRQYRIGAALLDALYSSFEVSEAQHSDWKKQAEWRGLSNEYAQRGEQP